MTPFFPLHHPAQIIEIEECLLRIPEAVHVATFDTSFHSAIPDEAAVYGLPFRYFHEKNYRRTGFHGHSHAYVSSAAATYLNRDPDELKLITCHLGNGCSVAAVRNGKSIDTSLGMTACEGLIMGTRCGDVDPGLMPIIMREESLSTSDVERMLYHESGLYGLSGISRDMREIENAALKGQKRAELALKAFCYKVKRYIGSMLMVLGGCDAIIFTGGIGTNSSTVRSLALAHSESLGFVLDEDLNRTHEPFTPDRSIMDVSSKESPIRIFIAQTNEEIVMARECIRVLNEWKQPGELDN
jgi:acetate kinase